MKKHLVKIALEPEFFRCPDCNNIYFYMIMKQHNYYYECENCGSLFHADLTDDGKAKLVEKINE
jgi:predicted RNA-binding Zn-ribbon protein involved in translation (DUF1610 family)